MSLIDVKFRRLMLDYPELVQRSILGPRQIEIVKFAQSAPAGWIYSREVAEQFTCTAQNASTSLALLVKAGYLRRAKVRSESGGIEYRYIPLFK